MNEKKTLLVLTRSVQSLISACDGRALICVVKVPCHLRLSFGAQEYVLSCLICMYLLTTLPLTLPLALWPILLSRTLSFPVSSSLKKKCAAKEI